MRSVMLVVLDGWGMRQEKEWNAVANARTPVFDRLWREYPHTLIMTSGEFVGLPPGQMGNSEVGHQNLGAGRVVRQDSGRISGAIADGSFFANPALRNAMGFAKEHKGRLHLLGLLSDGGVHSMIEHLWALLELAKRQGLRGSEVMIHGFLDGRDTSPTSGAGFVKQLQEQARALGVGVIGSLVGRYYAMDRDNRWERTQLAFRALALGEGRFEACTPEEAVRRAYQRGETDEFVTPLVFQREGHIRDGDAVISFNFRPDRMRQITRAFVEESFEHFARDVRPEVYWVSMTRYAENLTIPVAFAPLPDLRQTCGEVLSVSGMRQLRLAETEKYAHVTYFFNNGRERPWPGEEQVLIPSPKVATYDLKPEMSAPAVAAEAVRRIAQNDYGFVLINFANPDMVGHSGVYEAAVAAVEAVDRCLGQVVEAMTAKGGEVLLTADHGNADVMRDSSGNPHTAHTTNPAPFIRMSHRSDRLRSGGALCDVAPTVLKRLGLGPPKEMTGASLCS